MSSHFLHGDQPNVPTRSNLSDIPIPVGTLGYQQDIKTCPHTQTETQGEQELVNQIVILGLV